MPKISGTVYRFGTDERIQYASVKAWAKGKKTEHAITDDDGDYQFSNLDPGHWTLVGLEENSFPSSRLGVELTEDKSDLKIELQRLSGIEDEQTGKKFFYSVLASFGFLVVAYILLHLFIRPDTTSPSNTFIWTEGAWRYLEIILWSLAGILVHKIITIGWYLRSKRFYREGIVMHVSHIATTPLLVLVGVIILSLAKLTLTLANENEITLDLSNPNIMIAIAFILGTSPWPLIRFIEDTAKRVTGKL
jgi:hypothetical protein